MVKNQKVKQREATSGYCEGSKTSNALDYLVGEGIDCLKIAGSNRTAEIRPITPERYGTALFFPIDIRDNKYESLAEILYGLEGATHDNMEIKISPMLGSEIKRLNTKLKVDDDKSYEIIEISQNRYKAFLQLNSRRITAELH